MPHFVHRSARIIWARISPIAAPSLFDITTRDIHPVAGSANCSAFQSPEATTLFFNAELLRFPRAGHVQDLGLI
jgi:hypothetical protein